MCLVATDDEAFTYNKRVNRLAIIQEHKMIMTAIQKGVPEERLGRFTPFLTGPALHFGAFWHWIGKEQALSGETNPLWTACCTIPPSRDAAGMSGGVISPQM